MPLLVVLYTPRQRDIAMSASIAEPPSASICLIEGGNKVLSTINVVTVFECIRLPIRKCTLT